MGSISHNLGEAVVGSSLGGQDFNPQGTKPVPWYLQAAQDTPGTFTGLGFGGFRGSNTILRGGWSEASASGRSRELKTLFRRRTVTAGDSTWRGGSIPNNSPRMRNWTRYGSQDIFNPPEGSYTPWQVIDRASAWVGKKAGWTKDGEEVLSKGGYARVSAGARLMKMSASQYEGVAGNTMKFMGKAGWSAESIEAINAAGPRAMGQAVSMSGKGVASNYVSGMLAGASREGLDETVASYAPRAAISGARLTANWGMHAAEKAGIDLSEKLTTRAAGQLIKEGGIKGAGYVGTRVLGESAALAIPIVNIGMAAWMAYDLTKLGVNLTGNVLKGSVSMASQSIKSFEGGISNGMMGQGFKDNSVSITSRQRGVAAIQNSRLNARSILGSEGGLMAAHFG